MITTQERMPEIIDDAPLTAMDRCDACSAAAKVRVYMRSSGLDLLFCGHHMKKNIKALENVAYFNPDWESALQ